MEIVGVIVCTCWVVKMKEHLPNLIDLAWHMVGILNPFSISNTSIFKTCDVLH